MKSEKKIQESMVNDFSIICKNCQKAGRTHETQAYIDWKRRYYFFLCYTCNTSEVFDEYSKHIVAKTQKEQDEKETYNN